MLRAILWKELLELARDRRTLAAVVLMPLLGLPSMGLLAGTLYHEQVATLGVYYDDPQASGMARWIASRAASEAGAQGLQLAVRVHRGEPEPGCCAVFIYLPRGFYFNATSVSRRALVYVGKVIASQAADAAYSVAQGVLEELSRSMAVERVEVLARAAGVNVSPESVLSPLVVREYYYKPSGAPATQRERLAAQTARMLEFALIFVVNPAVVYVTDAIVGERERRTLEALLATPLGVREVVTGKMLASSFIGFTAALADTLGVIIFFDVLGGVGAVTPGLLVLHALVSGVLVVMTAAIIAPIAARSPTTRSAQATGMLVLGVATLIYFAALFTDLFNLPAPIEAALLAIPFTHAALAIQAYAVGATLRMAGHIAFMAAVALAGAYAASRLVDPERMVMLRD
ncbi:MAG: ABC transporter permease subunit [Desulfurococcales archaeon]|nr:ABC transporter permease subunit [Desulfurococcales archaeon]